MIRPPESERTMDDLINELDAIHRELLGETASLPSYLAEGFRGGLSRLNIVVNNLKAKRDNAVDAEAARAESARLGHIEALNSDLERRAKGEWMK